jgi:glucosylglycerate phosphorylase
MKLMEWLTALYGNQGVWTFHQIQKLIESNHKKKDEQWLDEKDIMLITYGDSITQKDVKPLKVLHQFLNTYCKSAIKNVHLLPMFPYTSDDGFSVVDYLKINPDLGNWEDIDALSSNYGLMFDGVVNHISKSSSWFQHFLNGEPEYKDFFIECDEKLDYSKVVRPRALPLYYPYLSTDGIKHIWATFSEDQVDLNYKNPRVLIRVFDVLIQYAKKGARFIRLDAIGFLWKQVGTSSIHLPETHQLIKIMRYVIDQAVPGTILISETNVPHAENISYFGDQGDEASLVYQFPLPPLTLYTFIKGDSTILMTWLDDLKHTKLYPNTTYFNFLASHDGIGLRPTEGILDSAKRQEIVEHVIKAQGRVSYKTNTDQTVSPYELNISYFDAITAGEKNLNRKIQKFMASQAILMFIKGMPGLYIHSLLGTPNDMEGLKQSGILRRINRKKLDFDILVEELNDQKSQTSHVFNAYMNMIQMRNSEPSFSPIANEQVVFLDKRVFSILRMHPDQDYAILVCINISNEDLSITTTFKGEDIMHRILIDQEITLSAYQYRLIRILKENL